MVALRSRIKSPLKTGFTLVEMSIVLVIIGLIIGGVLVGRDLIKAAEIRAQMTQVEKLNTAIVTFKGKYNCLPGDCATATTFFSSASQPSQVTNGNGNGMIDAGDPSNFYALAWQEWAPEEWKYVFDHLAAAGLWNMAQYDETYATGGANNRPGFGYPKCTITPEGQFVGNAVGVPGAFDCGMVVFWQLGAHYIRFGAAPETANGVGGYLAFSGGFTPNIAMLIDTKFDDGLPFSGVIQIGSLGSYQAHADGSDNTLDYNWMGFVTGPPYRYNITGAPSNYRTCSMRIRASGY